MSGVKGRSGGHNKKTAEQHRLEGTFRPKDHGKQEIVEKDLHTVCFTDVVELEPPATIYEDKVKEFFKNCTKNMLTLKLLSPADLPEIEQMCLVLQELNKVNMQLEGFDILEDVGTYTSLINVKTRLLDKFTGLATKYYISPSARARITLEMLEVKKKETEIKKELSPIEAVLAVKES